MSSLLDNVCKRCNHKHEKPVGYCGAPCKKAGHLCNCPSFVPQQAPSIVRVEADAVGRIARR